MESQSDPDLMTIIQLKQMKIMMTEGAHLTQLRSLFPSLRQSDRERRKLLAISFKKQLQSRNELH